MSLQIMRAKTLAAALLFFLASALGSPLHEVTTESDETSETEQMTTCLLQRTATLATAADDISNQFVSPGSLPRFQQNQFTYPYSLYQQQLQAAPQNAENVLVNMQPQQLQAALQSVANLLGNMQ